MITKSKRGELDTLVIKNDTATAEISLFGAHVLSYIPVRDRRERLWISPLTKLDQSKPIRGGIPICWPWFGDAPVQFNAITEHLPPHGFVRSQLCELVSVREINSGCDQIVLKPKHYPFKELQLNLELEIVITVSDSLSIELVTQNIGFKSAIYFAALHSYFQIDSIENVKLNGIDSEYIDKTQSMKCMPAVHNYRIDSETDRIHLNDSPDIDIVTPTFTTHITSQGHDSIVVWNPWEQLSKAMHDMTDEGYKQMICIETARTQNGTLDGKQSHTLKHIIR